MTRRSQILLLFLTLFTTLHAFAAIEGKVVNKTTGKPQPGVTVSATSMSQEGVRNVGSARSGADGAFKIEASAGGMHLLQAVYQGVTYNLSAPPGAPASNLTIEVFEVLPKLSAVDYEQHMILLETDGKELVVNETVIVNNDSQTTWYDPKNGTLRFYVPPSVQSSENLKARVLAPNSVPVERAPKSAGKGVWYMDVPVKPGQTRFDISYRMPAAEPISFSGRVLHEPGAVRLVVPQGIELKGEGMDALGVEPSTKAQVFGVKGTEFTVALTGAGTLRDSSASTGGATAAEGGGEAESEGPRIQQIQPPGYQRQWKWVLGITLAALALGFWAMFIKQAPQPPQPASGGRHKA